LTPQWTPTARKPGPWREVFMRALNYYEIRSETTP
jgi:hypothetical protein